MVGAGGEGSFYLHHYLTQPFRVWLVWWCVCVWKRPFALGTKTYMLHYEPIFSCTCAPTWSHAIIIIILIMMKMSINNTRKKIMNYNKDEDEDGRRRWSQALLLTVFLSRQGSGRGVWTLSTAWYDVAPSMVFTNAYPGFKPKCNSRDSIVQISERYVWCNHKSGWKKQTQQSGTIQLGRAFSWWLMPNKSSTSSGYLCTKFL